VVTLSDAAKVGQIDDVLFDPQYRQVLGFRVTKGVFSQAEALARESVTAIGHDALTVPSPALIDAQDRFPGLVGATTLSHLHGTRVVTEGGDFLGKVDEVELDDDVRTVTAYTLSRSLWERLKHGEPKIEVQDVVRLGEGGIMIVPNAVAERLPPAAT
jgi:uncharacterized protein YrrD